MNEKPACSAVPAAMPIVAIALAIGLAPLPAHAHGTPDEVVAATGAADLEEDHTLLEELFETLLVDAAEASATVQVSSDGRTRIISADGLPDHSTGRFPNANNPNAISTQRYRFSVPAQPRVSGGVRPYQGYVFGVALNGVVFDPSTAEFWNNDRRSGWRYEAFGTRAPNLGLDANNAHVQPNGAYHYHALPETLYRRLSASGRPTLIGYAADGFPIYGPMAYADAANPSSALTEMRSSYRLRSGTRPSGPGGRYDGTFEEDFVYVAGAGSLDECNGRTGVTPEYPEGTYYYVITASYPFIPRCFMGAPDSSFAKRGPGGGEARGPRQGRRDGRPGFGPAGGPRGPGAFGGGPRQGAGPRLPFDAAR